MPANHPAGFQGKHFNMQKAGISENRLSEKGAGFALRIKREKQKTDWRYFKEITYQHAELRLATIIDFRLPRLF
jgi:hypothetical protein